MDVRDIWFWSGEAKRRAWSRRVEACNAALLPYQKAEVVKQVMESLKVQGLEFAYGQRVDDTEKDNADRMAAVTERRKATRKSTAKPMKKPKKSKKIRRLK